MSCQTKVAIYKNRSISFTTNRSLNYQKAFSYRLFLCGTKQESAAAWLAAATRQLKFCNNSNTNTNTNNQNNSNQILQNQNCRSAYNAQIESNSFSNEIKNDLELLKNNIINFQNNNFVANNKKDDHDDNKSKINDIESSSSSSQSSSENIVVEEKNNLNNKNDKQEVRRKTSILRRPYSKSFCDMTYAKKNVRFADSIGLELENVHHFVNSPTPVTRRYSSYNPPNYLLNCEWNTDSWHGGKILSNKNKINNSNSNINDKFSVMKQNLLNDNNNIGILHPRYELTMMNFSNPSLNQLNFNHKLFEKNVLLHSITIAETTIYGIVSVMNKHFNKKVFIRYTFDNWKNHIEREANYMIGSHDGQTDKFSFVIYAHPNDFNSQTQSSTMPYRSPFYSSTKSSSSTSSTTTTIFNPKMFFAIRYVTGDGQEFWDNNDGQNYCLELKQF